MGATKREKENSRRVFLKHLAFFGAAGALVANGSGENVNRVGKPKKNESETVRSTRYKITPHIREYYRKAAL